jgi:hypothetical protein
MKRFNSTVSQTLSALVISIAAITAIPAQAQVECQPLTPAAIDSINIALDDAKAAADVAAVAAGNDPNHPSTYPNSLITRAKAQWYNMYLQWVPSNTYVPYINASNVALALDGGPNIEVNNALVGARWWASASAYNFAYTQPALSANYLVARQKIQAAMTKMDKLGYDGVRCGIMLGTTNPALLAPLLP